MRVRIPKSEAALLYGAMPEEVRRRLETISLPCRQLSGEDWRQTVGCCAELPGYPRRETGEGRAELPAEPMLVLQVSRDRLDKVLWLLRGLSTGPKAVLTRQNAGWTGIQLFRELCREREAIRQNSPPVEDTEKQNETV